MLHRNCSRCEQLNQKNKSIRKWETARFTANIGKVNNFLIYIQKSRENIFECYRSSCWLWHFRWIEIYYSNAIFHFLSHCAGWWWWWWPCALCAVPNHVKRHQDIGINTYDVHIRCNTVVIQKLDLSEKQFIMRYGSSSSLRFRMHSDRWLFDYFSRCCSSSHFA